MIVRPLVRVRPARILVVLVSALVAAVPGTGLAFDWATYAAWHSTWHAPNALDTPLRTYFIPRLPGHCDRPAYYDGYDCTECNGNRAHAPGGLGYAAPCESCVAPPACTACLSVRSERLGQIPNDLEAGAGAAVSAPGR